MTKLSLSARKGPLAALALIAVTLAVWAAEGDLDVSWGGDGVVNPDLTGSSTVNGATRDILQRGAQQPDGSFVLAGIADVEGSLQEYGPALFFAEVSSTGTITSSNVADPGTMTEVWGGSVVGSKVYVGGNDLSSGNHAAFVRRYSATGTLEAQYNRAASSTSWSSCSQVIGDSSGKIVAGCIINYNEAAMSGTGALLRFNADLSALDTTFSGDGIATASPPPGNTNIYFDWVAQDGSGNYYAVGFAEDAEFVETAWLAKFTSTGSQVTTGFGTNGWVRLTLPGEEQLDPSVIEVDSSGKVYVGGQDYHETDNTLSRWFVMRFTSAGALDTGWNGDGVFTQLQSESEYFEYDVAHIKPLPSGKVLVLGKQALYRFNSNGTLDDTWNTPPNQYELNNNTNPSELGGLVLLSGNSSALILGGVCGGCIDYGGGDVGTSTTALIAKVKLTEDTTPDSFSFTSQTGVALNTVIQSNQITVSGINGAATVTISGSGSPQWQVNNGAWTSASGSQTVVNGDLVRVRHTSAAAANTTRTTTLGIGGVSGTFSTTTGSADTVPDNFTFTAQTGVARSTEIESNCEVISGIDAAASISISGGTNPGYDIGCDGSYTSASGTISNGSSVRVRQTSSASFAQKTTTTLNIGGVTAPFDVTTEAGDTTPDAFTFTDITDAPTGTMVTSAAVTINGINSAAAISIAGSGGQYGIGCANYTTAAGTVTNGQTVCVRVTSSSSASAPVSTTLTVGGVADTFTVTTGATDTTPDAFAFVDQTDVAQNATITSAPVTITGISSGTPISVTGGEYGIGCTGYTSAAGTIDAGQTVCVRHTSPSSSNTPTHTVLTVGTASDTFTSTTAPDTTPNGFTFVDQADVARSTTITSAPITVTGIDGAASISITNGTYSVNGGAYTAVAGTVVNGNSVTVRHTSAAAFSTATNTTLTIGGVSDVFTSTTEAQDTVPDGFTFTDQTGVPLGSERTSNPVTVAGINDAAAVSVSGGTYSIGCTGSFTSLDGTINNGQTVCVRHTSAASDATMVSTTLNIGTVMDTFSSTTGDSTPSSVAFAAQNGVARGAVITSAPLAINGTSVPSAISVSNGSYSIGCGATYVTTAGTIDPGQTVCVRHTSSSAFAATTTTTLTVGGVSGDFVSTTEAQDLEPAAYAFVDQTGLALDTVVTSAPITITGINDAAPISVTDGEYSVGCASYTSSAGTVVNGDTVCVRHTSAGTPNTPVSTVLTVGGVSDTFTSTTSGPGTLAFSAATYTVNENAVATITVTRTGGVAGAVGVSYATADGTALADSDYTAASGTLDWANGDAAAKTFTVAIGNDAAEEAAETILLSLATATGGATLGAAEATLTIRASDVPAPAGGGGGGALGWLDGVLGLFLLARLRRMRGRAVR